MQNHKEICNLNVIIEKEIKNKAKMAALELNLSLRDFISEAMKEKILTTKRGNPHAL